MKQATKYITLLLPLAMSTTLFAQWEGAIDMKLTTSSSQAQGKIKMLIGKTGARSEMDMTAMAPAGQAGGANMKIVSLQKFANPNVVYMLNDANKTYSKVDVSEARKNAGGAKDDTTYTVKKGAAGSVAGYSCQNATLTSSKGDEMDMCVSKEFMSAGDWTKMMSRAQNTGGGNMMKALKDNGLEGMPIRMTMKTKGRTETVTTELVSAKKQAVPDSTFDVPAGYKETDTMGMFMSPEMQKQMEDAMKNLTPEQRKQIEQMMKKGGGGPGGQ
ncbi:MAG: hypothetical protein DIJKHBIC_01132 [Thermoanaerobaculia bacterium]|nr:hypothetical protein [Thermoanaerobaculia bacterium]